MPVLFEVGMLLKGKRADFAQKSHLPCYGGGLLGLRKGAGVHPLYLWARLVRLDQTSTDDNKAPKRVHSMYAEKKQKKGAVALWVMVGFSVCNL